MPNANSRIGASAASTKHGASTTETRSTRRYLRALASALDHLEETLRPVTKTEDIEKREDKD